jgi:hypothetical protein
MANSVRSGKIRSNDLRRCMNPPSVDPLVGREMGSEGLRHGHHGKLARGRTETEVRRDGKSEERVC